MESSVRELIYEGRSVTDSSDYMVARRPLNLGLAETVKAFGLSDPLVASATGILRIIADFIYRGEVSTDSEVRAGEVALPETAPEGQIRHDWLLRRTTAQLEALIPAVQVAYHTVEANEHVNWKKMYVKDGEDLSAILAGIGLSQAQRDTMDRKFVASLIWHAQSGDLISARWQIAPWSQSPYSHIIQAATEQPVTTAADLRSLVQYITHLRFITRLPEYSQLLTSSATSTPAEDSKRRASVLRILYATLVGLTEADTLTELALHLQLLKLPLVEKYCARFDFSGALKATIERAEALLKLDVFGVSKILKMVELDKSSLVFDSQLFPGAIFDAGFRNMFAESEPSQPLDPTDDTWLSPLDFTHRPERLHFLSEFAETVWSAARTGVETAEHAAYASRLTRTVDLLQASGDQLISIFTPSALDPVVVPLTQRLTFTTGAGFTEAPKDVSSIKASVFVPAYDNGWDADLKARYKKVTARRFYQTAVDNPRTKYLTADRTPPPYREGALEHGQDLPFGFRPHPYVGGVVGSVLSSADPEYLAALMDQTRFRFRQKVAALTSAGTSVIALRTFATWIAGLGYLYLRKTDADGAQTPAYATLTQGNRSAEVGLLAYFQQTGSTVMREQTVADARYVWCAPYHMYFYGKRTTAHFTAIQNLASALINAWQANVGARPAAGELPSLNRGVIPLTNNLVVVPHPYVPTIYGSGDYDIKSDLFSPFLSGASLALKAGELATDLSPEHYAQVERFHVTARPYTHMFWWPVPLGQFAASGAVYHVTSTGGEEMVTACHYEENLVVQGDKKVEIKPSIIDLLSRVLTIKVPGTREVDLKDYEGGDVWSL